ncbi:hypothetical protein ACEQUB_00759 [Ralstonia syzygii]
MKPTPAACPTNAWSAARKAIGLYGPAREYLQRTLIGLASNGLRDPYLDRLWQRLQAVDAANAPSQAADADGTGPLPDPYLSA